MKALSEMISFWDGRGPSKKEGKKNYACTHHKKAQPTAQGLTQQ